MGLLLNRKGDNGSIWLVVKSTFMNFNYVFNHCFLTENRIFLTNQILLVEIVPI